ncbi:MAG: Eco57I restriction-modification methylase domain-containing protein [Cyanobium sp.]|jgi:hypothetical protein
MSALASALRKTLETTVVKARDLAERGAREALTGLAVEAKEPFGSMGDEERRLRNRLRARGRQLGDQRDAQKGTQSIERLVREMAYEHWHRMLFARFLAENQLLIEPSSGVAVSLAECEELAAEAGTDLWELAASYAQGMLPEIFRTDDPVLALRLPLEIRQQLQALVAGLDAEVFTASDSLGWTYQFWQTKRKKEVNDSGVKIGADELSPVTQLFTEDYMVDFLLDNTLGAWHAGKMLAANPELASTAQTEDDLRQAVALPGCPWSYLRFVKSDDGSWTPAAGTFEGWPRTAAELKCLDPCMGSGHFVVAMFERLVALRLAEGEQMEAAAVAAVIEGNLFGLEIDPRCTQIAAFNLALAAWRRVGHCKLPAMNLACSGLAPNTREADWLAMAGVNERLKNGMERLYRLFQKASVLGSLINPRAAEGDLLVAAFHELKPLLEQVLAQESQDEVIHEMAVTARGLTKAAEILASQFTLVATNVPFLAKNNQAEVLRSHIGTHHPEGAGNLAMAMVERCQELCDRGATAALVTIQDWLFLKLYQSLRQRLLAHQTFNFIVQMGAKAFSTQMWDFNTMLLITSSSSPSSKSQIGAIDAMQPSSARDKALELIAGLPVLAGQARQLENPSSSIIITGSSRERLLGEFAHSYTGVQTGDDSLFRMQFWEIAQVDKNWRFDQGTVSSCQLYGGRSGVLKWQNDGDALRRTPGAYIRGEAAWGKRGVAVSQMHTLPVTLYSGECWNMNCAVIIPKRAEHLPALWAFCSSDGFAKHVRKINQSLKVNPGYFLKTPADFQRWTEVAATSYPQGLPYPESSDPTQWLFNGCPAGADQPLHAAVARLVGYQWPRQTGSSFPDCPALSPDGLEAFADNDGIVCLSPIRGEAAAADRLRGLLAAAFGDEWSNAKERELLLETAVANDARKAAADLGGWLRQSFFAEHCKLFQSRPFIWQIWDGNPHGFSALVNYHKLAAPNGQGRKTLELLTYTYLGDWIDRQKLDQAEGVNGADDRHAAALDLQVQLKKILDGEPPYDLFVRWKPLHQQAIGWDPDITDGVRLNIRPFLSAELRRGGKAGAGILRAKPGTIKWTKDRGKEPMRSKDEFPWFWGWDETNHALETDFGASIPGAPPAVDSFDGNRWNDLHYSRAAKDAARAKKRGEA